MDLVGPGPSIAGMLAVLAFVGIAAWEWFRPAWRPTAPAGPRWLANLSLYAIREAAVLGLMPWFAATVAARLPQLWPAPQSTAAALLHAAVMVAMLDLAYYLTHRMLHATPWLWRLHAVHHTDLDLDLTTTVRHHPFEALPLLALVGVAAALLGATPTEVAAYGVLAFAVQLLAHANVALPAWVERMTAPVLVTPAFHRRHHSRDTSECHANYGQVLALWDHAFGTAARAAGKVKAFGVVEYLAPRFQRLDGILLQPALRQPPR